MASNVRVTGPEFTSEQNQRAFLRIEDSARQYSAHSRESIYLVRRPLEISEDHFVLLWPRGVAVVGMYPYSGSIRGRERGEWELEPRRIAMGPRAEHGNLTFANPSSTLERARSELSGLLLGSDEKREPLTTEAAQENAKDISIGNAIEGRPASTAIPIAPVALFTGDLEQLSIADIGDALFSSMTIEDAVTRSIVHTPNLLRAAHIPGVSYSNDELERFWTQLERSANLQERNRKLAESMEPTAPSSRQVMQPWKARRWKLSPKWLVPLLLVLAALGIYVVRSLLRPNPVPPAPAAPPVSRAPSEIVIKMPIESELFISPDMFQTREALDRALTYGEGERFLPDTEQRVVMDSVSLAKGVYGYFKVDNTWRKGKLLQTLQPADTIVIVKFLDPLP